MTPMINPSPRLVELANQLDLSVYRSRGAAHSHTVYRGSLMSLRATLTRLGCPHEVYVDDYGPGLRVEGLSVTSGGGWGGVLIEDIHGSDETEDQGFEADLDYVMMKNDELYRRMSGQSDDKVS